MNKRKAYEGKLDAQLKEWDAQIALFKARANKTKAEVAIGYYKSYRRLAAEARGGQAKLREIKAASGEAWEGVKASAEKPGLKARPLATAGPQSFK